MFYPTKKEVVFELESLEVINSKPILRKGKIQFIYDNEQGDGELNVSNFEDLTKIIFKFSSVKTKEIHRLDNIIVKEKIIYSFDKDKIELIKLGEMKNFSSFEEAINILEKFVEEISIKE